MNPIRSHGAGRRQQQGATLLVAMIILVCLTLLGTWSASSNVLQERMAGNTYNRELALQAAEAALKDAEASVSTWRTQPFNGSNGLLAYVPTSANNRARWMDPAEWNSFRTVAAGGLNQVAQPPRYVIEKLPNTVNPANPTVFDVENYRVTARAVGGNPDAVVVLQSIVQFTP